VERRPPRHPRALPQGRILDLPRRHTWSDEFMRQYAAALGGATVEARRVGASRTIPGSVDDLCCATPHVGKARAQPIDCALHTPGTDAGAGRGWNRRSRLSAPHRAVRPPRTPRGSVQARSAVGLERDRLGNIRLLATGRVFGPLLRQIKPEGDREAEIMIAIDSVTTT
jgi:hypothetical protein